MKTYYLYIFLLSVFLTHLEGQVLGLNKEPILGGIPVKEPEYFEYQAVVRGIENNSFEYTLMGGAAILSDRFLLSAANIFLEETGELRNRRFSIVVGSHDLSSSFLLKIPIDRIYVPFFDPTFIFVNLAVIQLDGFIQFGRRSHLGYVELPYPSEIFTNVEAVVSGFGFSEASTELDMLSGLRVIDKESGVLHPILRYANVRILSEKDCQSWYSSEVTFFNMCAIMERNSAVDLTGVCFGDIGGPLVINNTVLIGIVSSTTLDCDNTRIGTLYTKVALFVDDIKEFMANNTLPDAFIRYNRPHIQPVVYA